MLEAFIRVDESLEEFEFLIVRGLGAFQVGGVGSGFILV